MSVSETGSGSRRDIVDSNTGPLVLSPEKEMAKSNSMTGVSGDWSVFRGPEMDKIDPRELKKIQIDIRRNISKRDARDGPVYRHLDDPLQLAIPRKPSEGKKPIFDREEFKTGPKDDKLEEQRVMIIREPLQEYEERLGQEIYSDDYQGASAGV